jgi:GntR family transcriptional regulator, transcriptional repressor for pyruvate dehydrogenase complex
MFQSVKLNKISENITEQIREAIFHGKLKPGDRLPIEKELMGKFEVSKGTIREALRSLEVLGFVDIRKGASGGTFVTEVDMNRVRDYFTNYLLFQNLSLTNLSEVRLILEPYIAEKAARLIKREDLKKLEKIVEQSEDALKKGTSNKIEFHEFHRILGNISGNPILIFIVDFIEGLLIDTKNRLGAGYDFSIKVLNAHKRIYKALSRRDARGARIEMAKHVREVERNLLAIQKERRMNKNPRSVFACF